jgi:phage tail-like protein
MDRKLLFALIGIIAFALVTSTVALSLAGSKTPVPSSNFVVEIDGIVSSSFASVEGVGSEIEVVEYREGSDPNEVILKSGVVRTGPIILKRGVSENAELWAWFDEYTNEEPTKKCMSIVLLDHTRSEKARYNFCGCWPSAYYIEPLESSPSNVAYEVLVVQCETMDRA